MGREFGDLGREPDYGRVSALEEGVVVAQFQHLAISGLGQFPAPVPDVAAPKPRHAVKDLVSLGIRQHHPFRAGDYADAAFGECCSMGERMQMVRCVQRPQFFRRVGVREFVHYL